MSRWTFNSVTINKPQQFWQLFIFNWCIPYIANGLVLLVRRKDFVSFWVFKIFMKIISFLLFLLLIGTILYENVFVYTKNWISRLRPISILKHTEAWIAKSMRNVMWDEQVFEHFSEMLFFAQFHSSVWHNSAYTTPYYGIRCCLHICIRAIFDYFNDKCHIEFSELQIY